MILSLIYLLVYIVLFAQFHFDPKMLIDFIQLDSSLFMHTITVQIEFIGLQIFKFYLINMYIDFYIQLKEMIDIRKGHYRSILFKQIMICALIIMLPDILLIRGISGVIRMILNILVFTVLYIVQLTSKDKIVFATSLLIYCVLLIFINQFTI